MAHILLVEDETDLSDVIVDALKAEGHTTVAVSDGIEAMVQLKAGVREGQPFALIICDIKLPGLSGLSVCDLVRLDPHLAHIPFLFLSGLGDTEQRLDGLARGADDYLAKPFLLNELIERVTWLLNRPATRQADTVSAPNPLEQRTFDDLLRDIVHNTRNGTLHFLLDDGSRGQIAFREGKAVIVVGDGAASPEDQLHRLFAGQVKLFHFA
ncbi:MAG: response regulator [Chloracidobacterium sp.]|nr:response regulator [Chloracidobacterium sp.]MDW8216523.1 response regulator [Acidobacteriota bacterium]